jgi:hypothetical protein
MARYLTARKVDDVSETAPISDYDELPDDQQEDVRRLVDGEAVGGGDGLDGEVIRYVEYYRIDSARRQASD